MFQSEMQRRADGAPERNLERYTRWRKDTRSENLTLLRFYGIFLAGQYSGNSSALSLPAMQAAFELDGLDRKHWPLVSRRLLFLHSQVIALQPKVK